MFRTATCVAGRYCLSPQIPVFKAAWRSLDVLIMVYQVISLIRS